MVPNSGAPIAMLQNIAIYYVFATLAHQKHPKGSILAVFGPSMSATPQFGIKIGAYVAPCRPYLKLHNAKKGNHNPKMSNEIPQMETVFVLIDSHFARSPPFPPGSGPEIRIRLD